VAENVGVTPLTGLLEPSFRLIVTVDVEAPLASTGPVPEIVELSAETLTGVNNTVPPVLAKGEIRLRVLSSAPRDFNVHVETPVMPVIEHDP
jgi:hypothetical protein